MNNNMPRQKDEMSTEEDRDKSTGSNIDDLHLKWSETLLTASFDDQIKLLEKSYNEDKGNNVNATSSKSVQEKQKDRKKGKPSKVQAVSEKQEKNIYDITHSSRKFRYQPDNDQPVEANSSIKDNLINVKEQDGLIVPPPFEASSFPKIDNEDEARASMMTSWYMAGYHTGYYQAMLKYKKLSS